MMIATLVPDPEALLPLAIEELSGVLLEVLNSANQGGEMNRPNFFMGIDQYPPYPDADGGDKQKIASPHLGHFES